MDSESTEADYEYYYTMSESIIRYALQLVEQGESAESVMSDLFIAAASGAEM